MTEPGPDAKAGYDQILIVVDRAPDACEWAGDRRLCQILTDLRALKPVARIVIVATERGRHGQADQIRAALDAEVVEPPTVWREWFAANAYAFSLVLLAGPASTHRLIELVRVTQPQAFVAAVASSLCPTVADAGVRFDHREEAEGQAYADELASSRLMRLIATTDAILCADEYEVAQTTASGPRPTRSFVYETARRQGDRPGFDGRSGLLSWGRFGAERGEPDEDALVFIASRVIPVVAQLAPTVAVTCMLERAPSGLSHHEADTDLPTALRRATALLIARRFGSTAVTDSLIVEAADAGTPVIALRGGLAAADAVIPALDAIELARVGSSLVTARTQWDAARSLIDARWQQRAPERSATQLAELLAAAGMASPATSSAPTITTRRVAPPVGPHTRQAQVQTAGFAERRPTAVAFARADFSTDDLWPDRAYEQWYEAHPLTDATADEIRRLASAFEHQPTISIVMPVYNTEPDVLEAAIGSVVDQLYPFWELCAVDDGSTDETTVATLQRLASGDPRIKASRLEHNLGIVGASNAAVAMSSGEFVALLDHDDVLTPDALFEVVKLLNDEPDLDFIYTDEDKIDPSGERTTPFFKPSWSPNLHLCVNYVTHFAVYRRTLLELVGGFRDGFDGSQDYDLSLRATEAARRVGHIAKPLYGWRMVPGSAAVAHDAKPYALDAARRAITDALARRGQPGVVVRGMVPGTWRPRYRIEGEPLVSILIPTRNGRRMLERCLDSISEKTTYRNFELVILDNGTDDPATLEYLGTLKADIVRYPYRFNYARQMNMAVDAANGDLVLFLNNDMEVITPGWLEAMVELAQHDDVGAVGARLVFPSGRPQHEGVFVSFGGGSAGNADFGGYFGMGEMIRDATAVTAACMLMRVEPFRRVGGFDERLRVAFNDVDLCLRLRQIGYRVVYTPYAQFFHAESASRGRLHPEEDEAFFIQRWGPPGTFEDPFYNPNLDPLRPFRLKR